MKQSVNYNLNKPDATDIVDFEILNGNMDIIDKALAPDFKDYTEANATIPTADSALKEIKKGSKASDLFSNIKAFCLNSLTFDKITTKNTITNLGQYALDGVEKNPNIDGSLAAQLKELNNNLNYGTVSINTCSTLNELATIMTNNKSKVGIGTIGILDPASNLKTLLGNPSGFLNYTSVHAVFVSIKVIKIYAISNLIEKRAESYLTNNDSTWQWTGWIDTEPYNVVPKNQIPSSTNLNDYTQIGVYRTINGEISSTILNTPYKATGFKLIVEHLSTEVHIMQTIKGVQGNDIYFRTGDKNSGSWVFTEWKSPIEQLSGTKWVTDADLVTEAGNYSVYNTTSNIPVSRYGILNVEVASKTWIYQTFKTTDGNVFTRRKINNETWTGWINNELSKITANLLPEADILATNSSYYTSKISKAGNVITLSFLFKKRDGSNFVAGQNVLLAKIPEGFTTTTNLCTGGLGSMIEDLSSPIDTKPQCIVLWNNGIYVQITHDAKVIGGSITYFI